MATSTAKLPVDFRVLIHGGAFVFLIGEERVALFEDSLTKIIRQIYSYVTSNAENPSFSAVDVCEYAVKLLEDDPLYNAGKGSVFTSALDHVLEASIMDGSNLAIGAASLLKRSPNPVSVARIVMDHSSHNYLAGEAVEDLAVAHGLPQVENKYFFTERRLEQFNASLQAQQIAQESAKALSETEVQNLLQEEGGKKGTVGCVCMYNGHVAAATSTGGMTGKSPGRIGDSPLVGAGTYADDGTCAISCTGTGEEIMRYTTAYDICARLKYIPHTTLQESVRATLTERMPVDTVGVLAIDRTGNYSMQWNTKGMLRATCGSDGECKIGVFDDEIIVSLE